MAIKAIVPVFLVAVMAVFGVAVEARAQQCTQTLSVGANVSSAVANAPSGSTICLSAGNYGTVNFTNINRTGFVTVKSTTGVDARLSLGEVYNSRYIRLASLTIAGASVRGCSENIEFIDSVFPAGGSGLDFNYDTSCGSTTNMGLLVDGVVFDRVRNATFEGRLSMRGVRGLQIRNSTFSGQPTSGQSDGIQIVGGSRDVTIGPGNLFSNILQSDCGSVHCDAIQAYGGGANTVISGNYFVNCSVYIGIYDGGSPSTQITNNVFDRAPNGQALQIGGVNGMLMRHNTFRNVTLGIGTKFANTPHSGWVVENNIFDSANFTASGDQPGCGSDCIMRYNLKSNGGSTSPSGTNSIAGTAVYVGAGSYANWGNWRLADGSPGRTAGNDGLDMGTTYFGGGVTPPPPPPTAPAAPTGLRVVTP